MYELRFFEIGTCTPGWTDWERVPSDRVEFVKDLVNRGYRYQLREITFGEPFGWRDEMLDNFKLVKAKDLKVGMKISSNIHPISITALETDSVKITVRTIFGKKTFYKDEKVEVWGH